MEDCTDAAEFGAPIGAPSRCTLLQMVLHVLVEAGFAPEHCESETTEPSSPSHATTRAKVPAARPVLDIHTPLQAEYELKFQSYSWDPDEETLTLTAISGRSEVNVYLDVQSTPCTVTIT